MAQLNLKALFSADTTDIKKGSKEAQQSVKAFKDEAGGAIDEFAGIFGTSISQLSGPLTAFRGGLVLLSKGFTSSAVQAGVFSTALKIMKAALISTGIGALLVALGSLVAYFTKSADGGDKLAKIMLVIKSSFGLITDVAVRVGRAIVSAFEDPRAAVKNLWEAIKTNIVNRFEGLVQTFGSLGKVVGDVFSGRWSDIAKDAKEAGSALTQVITGLDENQRKTLAERVKSYGAAFKKNMSDAKRLADIQDAIDDKKRAWIKTEADLEAKLADLRQKSTDKEEYSAAERLKYTRDAEKVFTRLWNGRAGLAAEEYAAEKQIYNLKKEHTDDEEAQLNQLYATWRGLETQKSQELKGFQREQLKIVKENQDDLNKELHKKKLQENWLPTIDLSGIQDTLKSAQIQPIKLPPVDFSAIQSSMQEVKGIVIDITREIESGLENMAIGFAESIGNMMSGTADIGDIGNVIVNALAEMAITIGKIAIEAGITMIAIKKMFSNPYTAIIAGVALVALGTAVKARINKATTGNYSSAASYSSGSVNKSNNYSSSSYTQQMVTVKVTGELTSRGNKLVAIVNNENSRKKLTS